MHPKRIRAPPISINTTQNTPRHHPDIPQTPPRQLQGTQHANRRQQTPTDTTRHTQTALSVTLGVWQCLLVSVGVCWHVMFAGDALGVSGGCLGGVWGHLEWHSFKSEVLVCVWGLSGFSVPAVWSQNTNLATPWKVWCFVTWPYWDVKISKPPYVTFPKMVGFNLLM